MKRDEQAITALADGISSDRIESSPLCVSRRKHLQGALIRTERKAFAGRCTSPAEVGVYQHSTVIRDDLVSVVKSYGAEVIPLGRSQEFIPVDTEAVPESLVKLLKHWSDMHRLDAIVSPMETVTSAGCRRDGEPVRVMRWGSWSRASLAPRWSQRR